MSNEKKLETVNIMEYLVAKNGTTKYLKVGCSPKADDKTKKLVADLIALLGGDVLYVNLFDADFKAKYNIPDFSKGRVSVPVNGSGGPVASKNSSGEVNF